jgi:hypothetical protein
MEKNGHGSFAFAQRDTLKIMRWLVVDDWRFPETP